MIQSPTGASPLLEAAAVAGGVQALARRLRVPTKQLSGWMAGDSEAPPSVVQRAVAFLQRAFEAPGMRG